MQKIKAEFTLRHVIMNLYLYIMASTAFQYYRCNITLILMIIGSCHTLLKIGFASISITAAKEIKYRSKKSWISKKCCKMFAISIVTLGER